MCVHLRTANAQTSLRICAGWSVPSLFALTNFELYSVLVLKNRRPIWDDNLVWACLVTMPFCCFSCGLVQLSLPV